MAKMTNTEREKTVFQLRRAIERNENFRQIKAHKRWHRCEITISLASYGRDLDFPVPSSTIQAILPQLEKDNKALITKLGKQLGLCGKA